jgi:hypothetical protein
MYCLVTLFSRAKYVAIITNFMNLKMRRSAAEHRNVLVPNSFQILLTSGPPLTLISNGHFMQRKIVTYLLSDFLAQISVFPESRATW